jgi:hypothetical protein
MKKVLFLMISVLILGLIFTGCSEIAKFSSPATVNTDGVIYKCECFGPESATGMGLRIVEKENGGGTWFMYNYYPTDGTVVGNLHCIPIQAGNPKNGDNIIGTLQIKDLGSHYYRVQRWIDPVYTIMDEHLAISNTMNFTGKPGKDDNQDFYHTFYDADGLFYVFAHFSLDCASE